MNKKVLKSILFLLAFFIFISNAKALTVKENKMWTDEMKLSNSQYNTRNGSGSLSRQTKHIGGFTIASGDGSKSCASKSGPGTGNCEGARWYCIEPGVPLESGNQIKGASIFNPVDNDSQRLSGDSSKWTWSISKAKENKLDKVLSCWYFGSNKNNDDNYYSIMATQVITWEIVTEERYNILTNKILASSPNYAPYLKDGKSTFASKSGITSLYEIISNTGSGKGKAGNETKRKKLYQAYKEVLSCAARFDKNPSKSYTAKNNSTSNPVNLSSYDDKTQKFSISISDSLLDYYKISDKGGLTASLSNGKLSVSTTKEISKNNPAVVTLKYSYITRSGIDGKSHALRDDGSIKYLLKKSATSSGKYPQAMARGSQAKTVYIAFYTASKPKYQLKLEKKDDGGNPLKDISFYICSADNIKSGQSCGKSNSLTTIKTNASGIATYSALPKLGQYVAQEVSAPSGYAIDSTPATFNVIASNRAGTNSYAKASKTFVNKKMHLKMLKRTLDDSGNVIDLPNDQCPKNTCQNQGPVFNITSNNKKVCVKRDGTTNKYTFVGLKDSCASGETDNIETCDGAFDIELVPAGTYVVTEKYAPCNMTLPSNNSQTVVIKPNTPVTTVTMLNGVTGLVFTKVSEDGTLLDGGKYTLQMKKNGVYEDMILVHDKGAIYKYQENATTTTENATYLLETQTGTLNVKNLPKGEYRMVEKQAPEGYNLIKEKDSTATVTITDKAASSDYYQIKLVNQKTTAEGSSDQAEFVVTIKTGRNVINYPIVVGIVVIVLVIAFIIRKKIKK